MIDVKNDIKNHALEKPKEEVCGIIFLNERFEPAAVKCRNTHPDPESSFKISLDELYFVKNKYKILALYHSHPNSPATPTPCDVNNSEENGYPMYIYSVSEDSFYLYRPAADFIRPLKGRPFAMDVNTCLTCVLDYFAQKYGPPKQGSLKNFVVPNDIKSANNKILEIAKNSHKFCPVKLEEVDIKSPIEQDDVLVMNPGLTHAPYHLGVISKQGMILHHILGQLSTEGELRDLWIMLCIKRFRVISIEG
jgi:proteasome lid subunit RPN8/RPN11